MKQGDKVMFGEFLCVLAYTPTKPSDYCDSIIELPSDSSNGWERSNEKELIGYNSTLADKYWFVGLSEISLIEEKSSINNSYSII